MRRRAATIVVASAGVLLLASATACGDSTEGDRVTPPETSQSNQATPEPPQPSPAATNAPDRAPIALDEELLQQVRTSGSVSVIVTLDIPYRPEAELAGPSLVEAQRTAIATAQDELTESIPNATVTTRMTLFPQLVISVDEDGLRQLAASPLVQSIDENRPGAPTS